MQVFRSYRVEGARRPQHVTRHVDPMLAVNTAAPSPVVLEPIPPSDTPLLERLPGAGLVATLLLAIIVTVVSIIAAFPGILDSFQKLSHPTEATMARLDVMIALTASTGALILASIVLTLLPDNARVHRRLLEMEAKLDAGHQALMQEVGVVREQVTELHQDFGAINDSVVQLTRQVVEAQVKDRTHRAPERNGTRALGRDALAGAGPGPVDTLEPQMVQESRLDPQKDGGYQILPLDHSVPASISRLERDHPATRWRVYLCLAHSRECLEGLVRLAWSVHHYSRIAAYQGRRIDLNKLEVRILESEPTGQTTVLMTQIARNGDLRLTAYQYVFDAVMTGERRLAVMVNGDIRERALQRRDQALEQGVLIQAGALRWLLGDCFPDHRGRVRAEAVERWLSQPLPTLGDLVNWRPDWPSDPDQPPE